MHAVYVQSLNEDKPQKKFNLSLSNHAYCEVDAVCPRRRVLRDWCWRGRLPSLVFIISYHGPPPSLPPSASRHPDQLSIMKCSNFDIDNFSSIL